MISLEPTEKNKELAKTLSTRLKTGTAVVRKGKKGNPSNHGDPDGFEGDTGDLKLVPLTEQTIIQKDTE
jgi:hypothetical protein